MYNHGLTCGLKEFPFSFVQGLCATLHEALDFAPTGN